MGWRKPHLRIFQLALERLKVTPEETIYLGDSPEEDLEGAKNAGMRFFFVPSQFFTVEDAKKSLGASLTVINLCKLPQKLKTI